MSLSRRLSPISALAADSFGLSDNRFEQQDIHIHIPEGAVPKDGPSAGITLATAILSALTGKSVRKDIAMTGEITLRGRVLPIGGLKEKALAAYRNGIFDIIIPEENEKDEADIPTGNSGRSPFPQSQRYDTGAGTGTHSSYCGTRSSCRSAGRLSTASIRIVVSFQLRGYRLTKSLITDN